MIFLNDFATWAMDVLLCERRFIDLDVTQAFVSDWGSKSAPILLNTLSPSTSNPLLDWMPFALTDELDDELEEFDMLDDELTTGDRRHGVDHTVRDLVVLSYAQSHCFPLP